MTGRQAVVRQVYIYQVTELSNIHHLNVILLNKQVDNTTDKNRVLFHNKMYTQSLAIDDNIENS